MIRAASDYARFAMVSKRLRALSSRRDFWITVIPAALLVVAAFAGALHFVKPAPPKTLVLGMGNDEGGGRYYAKKYKEILAKHGITVDVRETDGLAENVKLLLSEKSDIDVAFVQSGTEPKEKGEDLVSLGALSYIPLWVFYQGDTMTDPGELMGKRIAVGPEDSGTRALAEKLLELNGAKDEPTELLPLGREEATEALKKGEIDALFTIAPAESPAIRKLAREPGIKLMSFARAEAYSRKLPYLTKLVLPRGVFDFAGDVPSEDIALVAPTANLVARTSLHPALAYLLLQAATEVHSRPGLLTNHQEFPAARETGFPLSPQAKRYYQSGVPLLQRYLPFWAANLVDRLWVMLLPIIAILVPLFRLIPPLYRWRVRSRIYRWYGRLKELELELEDNPDREALEGMLKRLDEIENAVNHVHTPLSYTENLYSFRVHVDLIRRQIIKRLAKDVGESVRLVG
jgi:TRAP transporter TAXI family solute receptor